MLALRSAARIPAATRSLMSDASSSAIAPMMVNIARLCAARPQAAPVPESLVTAFYTYPYLPCVPCLSMARYRERRSGTGPFPLMG